MRRFVVLFLITLLALPAWAVEPSEMWVSLKTTSILGVSWFGA